MTHQEFNTLIELLGKARNIAWKPFSNTIQVVIDNLEYCKFKFVKG